MANYDCIVIGGGHNGLVTAAYLAREGKRVCVLERRHLLGGCACSEALWPGYKVSTAAYVISLMLPEVIADLRLRHHGLTILRRNPSSFTPLLDGRSLTMGPDEEATRQQISQFSSTDANAYPRYQKLLENLAAVVEPMLMKRAPQVVPLPKEWRSRSLPERLRQTRELWSLYQDLGLLGNDLPEAVELLTGAARPLLERWFESEVLRATLATDAIIGAFASISAPGTAYVLLHHVMGRATGQRGVWGYVQGGMGGLADALEATCKELHVEIVRECEVHKILVEAGRVRGVAVDGGRTITASSVASSIDADWTYRRLVDEKELPAEFLQAINRIDYSSASAKINLALGEAPCFQNTSGNSIGPEHQGTIHISPTLDYIEKAYADARQGRPSEEPVLEVTIPTSLDSTIAPEGKHLMSIFVQYAPYQLQQENWDDIKESFADRCIELLGRYAPNLPGAVEHRQVLSPLDLEKTFRLTGGNIFQGAMNPHQLYCFRPVAGWADHRSPVKGLYLCGAASHPGGGVMGACGRNAAAAILQDL